MPRTRSQGAENDAALAGSLTGQVKRGVVLSPASSAAEASANPLKVAKREAGRTFGDITNAISGVSRLGLNKGPGGKSKGPGLASVSEAPKDVLKPVTRPASLPSLADADQDDNVFHTPREDVAEAEAEEGRRAEGLGLSAFDRGNLGNVWEVPLYAEHIFLYYRTREAAFAVDDYLARQTNLTKGMRMILVDWMADIQEQFRFNHETLYLGVKMVDVYLARLEEKMEKEDVQLIGATALFIAAKFDERQPACLDDFQYICDDAYARDLFIVKEREILKVIGFDLGAPLSYRYLRRFAKVGDCCLELLTLARYILETSLLHYECVELSEAKVAAAALLLACRMGRVHGAFDVPDWDPALRDASGFEERDIHHLSRLLNKFLTAAPEGVKTIKDKYSDVVFHHVALIKPLDPAKVLPML